MPHKLLLADDSVTIQRVIELTFADEDVQVIAVGNGQDAIDRVQRDRPDIVLADVGMPERNGYEVAAFVKGNPATAHIPVVLLTGAFEPVDEGRARAAGCDGVLVKPFEPQIVISRVKELLAGRKPSGMWGSSPGSVRQPPASEFSMHATPGGAARGADPLEAYFDHLDAAFASAGTGQAPDPFSGVPPAPAQHAELGVGRREPIPISRRPGSESPGFAQPTKATANDPFADWDPDLVGDPSRPAPPDAPLAFPPRGAQPRPVAVEAPVTIPDPPPVAPPQAVATPAPAQPASAPQAPAPAAVTQAAPPAPALPASLVDAFAALLAAEQKMGLAPSAATMAPPGQGAAPAPPPAPVVTDEMLEAVAARVLARLTDQSRPTILEVAERLVREEIERIKQNG
jgi:CheY-like chemotaxis protein